MFCLNVPSVSTVFWNCDSVEFNYMGCNLGPSIKTCTSVMLINTQTITYIMDPSTLALACPEWALMIWAAKMHGLIIQPAQRHMLSKQIWMNFKWLESWSESESTVYSLIIHLHAEIYSLLVMVFRRYLWLVYWVPFCNDGRKFISRFCALIVIQPTFVLKPPWWLWTSCI